MPRPLLGSRPHHYANLVFLVRAARDNLERVIRQRPLQRLRLVPRRAHPDVPLLVGRQDHRHGLGVDRLDHRVRRRRQEAVDEMRAGDRLRLGATVALELGPDAGEGDQRPVVIQREPDDVLLLGLGVRLRRVFGEAVERHQAAVLRLQPSRANAATTCCGCW